MVASLLEETIHIVKYTVCYLTTYSIEMLVLEENGSEPRSLDGDFQQLSLDLDIRTIHVI